MPPSPWNSNRRSEYCASASRLLPNDAVIVRVGVPVRQAAGDQACAGRSTKSEDARRVADGPRVVQIAALDRLVLGATVPVSLTSPRLFLSFRMP